MPTSVKYFTPVPNIRQFKLSKDALHKDGLGWRAFLPTRFRDVADLVFA